MKKYFIQQFLYSTAFMAALTGYNYASSGASSPAAQSGISNFTTVTSQTLQFPLHTTTNPIIPTKSQKSFCTLTDTDRTRMIQTWRLNEVQALMNISLMSRKMVVDSMYIMFEYVVRNTTGIQKTANDDGIQINLKELPASTLRENFWGDPFYKIVLGLLHGADILSKNESIPITEGTHSLISYENGVLTFHTLPTENKLKQPSQTAVLDLLVSHAKTDEVKDHIANSLFKKKTWFPR